MEFVDSPSTTTGAELYVKVFFESRFPTFISLKHHRASPMKFDGKRRLVVGWRARVAIGAVVQTNAAAALALHERWQTVFEKEHDADIARRQWAAVNVPKNHFMTCMNACVARV